MRFAHGLRIPQTVEDACDPSRMALLIYDMQAGIVQQTFPDGDRIVAACVRLREAARANGFRVFYTRHMSRLPAAAGAARLRTAMEWQHVDNQHRSSPPSRRVGRRIPAGSRAHARPRRGGLRQDHHVGLAATPLDIALRDLEISSFAIAGIAIWRSASNPPCATPPVLTCFPS
ncbi:cysteine hydrolase family protein [Streptomyces murinus]|uniref:cysteine hydrolase family protein n=1 Tax=Streptomyces murinus TaxID=33900 RepID=UPI003F4851AC